VRWASSIWSRPALLQVVEEIDTSHEVEIDAPAACPPSAIHHTMSEVALHANGSDDIGPWHLVLLRAGDDLPSSGSSLPRNRDSIRLKMDRDHG
jgi:hypothetical protein